MKDYARVDIEGTGKLPISEFPLTTIAVVGSIIALKAFLLVFLLVSI